MTYAAKENYPEKSISFSSLKDLNNIVITMRFLNFSNQLFLVLKSLNTPALVLSIFLMKLAYRMTFSYRMTSETESPSNCFWLLQINNNCSRSSVVYDIFFARTYSPFATLALLISSSFSTMELTVDCNSPYMQPISAILMLFLYFSVIALFNSFVLLVFFKALLVVCTGNLSLVPWKLFVWKLSLIPWWS